MRRKFGLIRFCEYFWFCYWGQPKKLVNSWPAHPQYWFQEQYYCRTPYRSSPLLLSKVVNFQLGKSEINKETCHKVPKVTSLVIFGFSTLLLSLLSGGRYFRMAKTCTPHKHLIPKNKIATKVKGIVFEKKYFISCTLRVMNRHVKYSLFINFGSLWHLFRISIITSFFFSFPAKKEKKKGN